MKKFLSILSVTIISLTLLSLFSFAVRYVALGGESLGFLTKPLLAFSTFPSTMKKVLLSDEIKNIPPTYIPIEEDYVSINELNRDLFYLGSQFSLKNGNWEFKLRNLRNDSVEHSWFLSRADFLKTDERNYRNSRPKNPILLANRSIIFMFAETKNLYRINSRSDIMWHNNDVLYHHSINLDHEGNIWACSTEDRKLFLGDDILPYFYEDDCITKLDINTGEILYHKSVGDILIENGFTNFVFGFTNDGAWDGESDPLHLNDIQPALSNSKTWKVGDLFLSLRHKSLIIQFRPETNKIVRIIQGPFLLQHDVDIVSENQIMIFNNNSTTIGRKDDTKSSNSSYQLNNSGLITYNLEEDIYDSILCGFFAGEKIHMHEEGIYENTSWGDILIENQPKGILYLIDKDKIVYKRAFSADIENMVHMLNWGTLYEDIKY